jgi:hypothetical protein
MRGSEGRVLGLHGNVNLTPFTLPWFDFLLKKGPHRAYHDFPYKTRPSKEGSTSPNKPSPALPHRIAYALRPQDGGKLQRNSALLSSERNFNFPLKPQRKIPCTRLPQSVFFRSASLAPVQKISYIIIPLLRFILSILLLLIFIWIVTFERRFESLPPLIGFLFLLILPIFLQVFSALFFLIHVLILPNGFCQSLGLIILNLILI